MFSRFPRAPLLSGDIFHVQLKEYLFLIKLTMVSVGFQGFCTAHCLYGKSAGEGATRIVILPASVCCCINPNSDLILGEEWSLSEHCKLYDEENKVIMKTHIHNETF